MSTHDLVVRSRRVVTTTGTVPADVFCAGGRIEEIRGWGSDVPSGCRVDDVGDRAVMPGLVDTHVHVNEPGTDWEGFASATAAAAAGGITSIVDMPLNSLPVTCTGDALREKRTAATGAARIDYGFWGGVIPGNTDELPGLVEAGVLGFKCFLVDSGLPEFPAVDEPQLRAAMAVIAALGSRLLVHAELPGPIAAAVADLPASSARHSDWLASRPASAEMEAIQLVIDACRATGCPMHIVHVSAAESLDEIRAAKSAGLPITAETCPHYLVFASEEVPAGATAFKCAPPLREGSNRHLLWEGLADGTLDLVASDHSPCPGVLKRPDSGDFFAAWGGVSSLQVSLSASWTAASDRGHGLEHIARWMAAAPAQLAGLDDVKGSIAPGQDADLVVFDPEKCFRVEAALLHHRHPVSPYDGRTLRGTVERTYLRGRPVFDSGRLIDPPRGVELHLTPWETSD